MLDFMEGLSVPIIERKDFDLILQIEDKVRKNVIELENNPAASF